MNWHEQEDEIDRDNQIEILRHSNEMGEEIICYLIETYCDGNVLIPQDILECDTGRELVATWDDEEDGFSRLTVIHHPGIQEEHG